MPPEVWCVTFEPTRDNVTYDTRLGAETRILGGWQLTGMRLLLGQNLFIRARSYYAQGSWNVSNSVIESVWNIYLPVSTIYIPLVNR